MKKKLLISLILLITITGCAQEETEEYVSLREDKDVVTAFDPVEKEENTDEKSENPRIGVEYKTIQNMVNIRKEPESGSEVLDTLELNETVSLLGVEGDWAKISNNGTEGYIYFDLIVPVEEVSGNDTEAPEKPEILTVNVANLNVRQEPTVASPVVAVLSQGDEVEILSEEKIDGETWAEIKSGEITGFVLSDYVEEE